MWNFVIRWSYEMGQHYFIWSQEDVIKHLSFASTTILFCEGTSIYLFARSNQPHEQQQARNEVHEHGKWLNDRVLESHPIKNTLLTPQGSLFRGAAGTGRLALTAAAVGSSLFSRFVWSFCGEWPERKPVFN